MSEEGGEVEVGGGEERTTAARAEAKIRFVGLGRAALETGSGAGGTGEGAAGGADVAAEAAAAAAAR